MNTLTHNWLRAASGSRAASLRLRSTWWHRGWLALRKPTWPMLAGCLLAPVILVAFVQVMLASVQRAESRHRAANAQAHSLWRCNFLHGANERAACRAQLDERTAAPSKP